MVRSSLKYSTHTIFEGIVGEMDRLRCLLWIFSHIQSDDVHVYAQNCEKLTPRETLELDVKGSQEQYNGIKPTFLHLLPNTSMQMVRSGLTFYQYNSSRLLWFFVSKNFSKWKKNISKLKIRRYWSNRFDTTRWTD